MTTETKDVATKDEELLHGRHIPEDCREGCLCGNCTLMARINETVWKAATALMEREQAPHKAQHDACEGDEDLQQAVRDASPDFNAVFVEAFVRMLARAVSTGTVPGREAMVGLSIVARFARRMRLDAERTQREMMEQVMGTLAEGLAEAFAGGDSTAKPKAN